MGKGKKRGDLKRYESKRWVVAYTDEMDFHDEPVAVSYPLSYDEAFLERDRLRREEKPGSTNRYEVRELREEYKNRSDTT